MGLTANVALIRARARLCRNVGIGVASLFCVLGFENDVQGVSLVRTFSKHDWDLWIRTSGQKVTFCAFGTGRLAENVGKSQGMHENNALGEMTFLFTFLGPWMAISCQKKRSPCFGKNHNVSCVLLYFLTPQHRTTHTAPHAFLWFFFRFFSVFPTLAHICTHALAIDRYLTCGLSKSMCVSTRGKP